MRSTVAFDTTECHSAAICIAARSSSADPRHVHILVAEAQRRRARLAAERLERRRAVVARRANLVVVGVRERGDLGERAARHLELRPGLAPG